MSGPASIGRDAIADAMARGFIAAEGTRLRREDETKVDELVGMLDAVARVLGQASRRKRFVLVDAAAGKGYVGVLAAALLLRDRDAEVVLLEREADRIADALIAAERLGVRDRVRGVACDVDDRAAYPESAGLVVGLHACGDASDRILECAIASHAARLLLVPCCVGKSTRGVGLADSVHASLGLPTAAPIARRLVHAIVDGERILRLESAGYETEAIEFVTARVTPYNVMLRARRVGEPVRTERSRVALERLRASGAPDAGPGSPTDRGPAR